VGRARLEKKRDQLRSWHIDWLLRATERLEICLLGTYRQVLYHLSHLASPCGLFAKVWWGWVLS
jgi:Uri superfamily endonuclease